MSNKKAQGVFGLSFGAIFSIFIILLIVAVAIYAISHFLSLNTCTQVGLFEEDFQTEVEKAWSGTAGSQYNDYYNGTLPQGGLFGIDVELVCFGKLNSATVDPDAREAWRELDEYAMRSMASGEENLFIYPPEEACDGDLAMFKVACRGGGSNCMTTNNRFFCVEVHDGNVAVVLRKSPTETLVTVSEN